MDGDRETLYWSHGKLCVNKLFISGSTWMQPFIRSIKIYSSMLLLPTEVQVAAVKALIEKIFAVLLLFKWVYDVSPV